MKPKVDIKCYISQQDWESLPQFGYFFGRLIQLNIIQLFIIQLKNYLNNDYTYI